MKDLGKLTCFIGIDFHQNEDVVKMNQKRYILKVLERFSSVNQGQHHVGKS